MKNNINKIQEEIDIKRGNLYIKNHLKIILNLL